MQLIVGYDITPENAADRGYGWFADAICDPEAPTEVNQEFYEWAERGVF